MVVSAESKEDPKVPVVIPVPEEKSTAFPILAPESTAIPGEGDPRVFP